MRCWPFPVLLWQLLELWVAKRPSSGFLKLLQAQEQPGGVDCSSPKLLEL